MLKRLLPCVGLVFLSACVSLSGTTCSATVGFNEADSECIAAGGTCGGAFGCERGTHSGPSCLLALCCLPGPTCEDNGGRCVFGSCGSSASVPGFCSGAGSSCCAVPADTMFEASTRDAPGEASSGGTCDGLPCAAGCACEPAPDAGARGVCTCGAEDAGSDAATDASTDAPDDAADDASDASTDAPPASEPCGVITCRGGCVCVSANASECVCP